MELRDIEIFLTLAEELHFGRTAERLFVSSARVSQAIKEMERRFGVLLFERTSRQVSLTPIGRQLRDDLLPGYRQIQQAIEKTTAAGKGFAGVLRVGYAAAWCGDLVIKAADVFKARHPECCFQFQEVILGNRFGDLRSGALDVQLTEFPTVEDDITAGPVVYSEPRAMIVPVGHPLAEREFVTLEDLAHGPVVTVAGPPDYWLDYHLPHFTPLGRPITRGPVAHAWQEVLAIVGAGKGICVTAVRAGKYYGRPDLVFVPFDEAPPVDFGFTWLTSAETVKVREFVQTALEVRALEDGPAPAAEADQLST